MKLWVFFVIVLIINFSTQKQVFLGKVSEKQNQQEQNLQNETKKFSVKLKKVELTQQDRQKTMQLITESQSYSLNKNNDLKQFLETSSTLQNQGKNLKLYNFQNDQYMGELAFSNPENTFKMIFDTGSANTWVNSKRCSDAGCQNHKQYDYEASTNFQQVGFDLNVHFGTGELSGVLSEDTVYLGGIPIEKQQFAEITNEEGDIFKDSQFDGIMGMSYPEMAAYDMNPVFDNIMKQHRIEKNMFSFYMGNKENTYDSELTIGGYDNKFFTGDINYHKITNKNFWLFKADNILIDNKDIGLCSEGCNLIADTGTSLITSPNNKFDKVMEAIQVEDSCTGLKDLPVLTFVVDGINYDLTSDDYVVSEKDDNAQYSEEAKSEMLEMGAFNEDLDKGPKRKDCALGMVSLDLPREQGNAWILGNTFLRKYYSIYDRDNNQVGFAKAKQ